jgi:hypothetical protein
MSMGVGLTLDTLQNCHWYKISHRRTKSLTVETTLDSGLPPYNQVVITVVNSRTAASLTFARRALSILTSGR